MAEILYIDKDAAVINHFRPVLEKVGHTVHAAASAQEARQYLASNRPVVKKTPGLNCLRKSMPRIPPCPLLS